MHHFHRGRVIGSSLGLALSLALVPGFAFAGPLSLGKSGNTRFSPAPTGVAESMAAPTIDVHGLKIESPWARATPHGAKTAVGYLRIVNETNAPDRLIGISTPAAAKAELHETIMSGTVARMRAVAGGIEIPAGATITLKPGSYHLMFLDIKTPFKKGSHVKATLDFQKAGKVDVEFMVEGIGAGSPHEMHMH